MMTFYLASGTEQAALLTCLFFSLILCVFYMFASLERRERKRNITLNAGVFISLLLLLCITADAFDKKITEVPAKPLLPLPMWVLWCIVGVSGVLLLCQTSSLIFQKGKTLSHNSVKQAFDTLPSAICYFTPSGRLKLCNLQMHRLFRILAQSDLQSFDELQQALMECDKRSNVLRLPDEKQTYLFPNGKVWRYVQSKIAVSDGTVFTEVIFSDVTELYEKSLKLKEQTKQLEKFASDLKILSDNVLTLTKETEVLLAKTKLHDQMGAGIIAIRQVLRQEQISQEAAESIQLFRKAVSAIKSDSEYPLERGEFAEFLQDASTIGVKVELTGELPKQEELYRIFVIAMRESLTNCVRHADATELSAIIIQGDGNISLHITNNGKPPKSAVTPKGGLLNVHRHIINLGGSVEIQWSPVFVLTITMPTEKEAAE